MIRVPADYEKIREENIARYGWDTAVLDLLGQLNSERTHFIFELIQNAEDAGATELAFELFEDRLELRHDGRPFTEADVRGICGVGQSGKSADLTAIGKFGIGFKSVYAYTRSPRVYSSAEHFRIANYVRPFAVEPLPVTGTLFVFPFDHDTVPAADRAEYADLLADLAVQGGIVLDDPGLARPDGRPYDGDVLDRVREAALARASFAEVTEPDTVSPRDQYRNLMLRILAAERAELLVARSAGRYRSRTLTRAQRALDLMEATLQQIPDLADPES